MELQRYIGIGLSGSTKALTNALAGLTQEEVDWRPASGCNSIGLILFHMARSEDSIMQGMLRNTTTVWESGKWFEKLGMAKEDDGSHYAAEQVNAFKLPDLDKVMGYFDAVRAKTKEQLRSITVQELDEIVAFPTFGEMPVAVLFSFIIAHNVQHTGEISYLRGMQRGIDN